MGSQICSTNCGTLADPPVSFFDNCNRRFRKYGSPYYAIVRCDVVLPDPTDIGAWTALVAAGTLQLSPCGKIDIPTPDQETSDDVDICGGTTVLETTYNLTFSSYFVDDNYEDCYYYADLLGGFANFRLLWFDCNGAVSLPREYVDFVRGVTGATAPTGTPGFAATISSVPHATEGDGQKVNWEFTAEIVLDGSEIICPVVIPGLLEALQAA